MPYIFQGDCIVVPADTQDSLVQNEVDFEFVKAAFGSTLKDADIFAAPCFDGQNAISIITLDEGELPASWKAVPLRQTLNTITGGGFAESSGLAGRLLRSRHLSNWRRDSRFCGRCGGVNRDADFAEPSRKCSVCENLEYPRIAPAVIVIITNDYDEILLAHNKKFASGLYSLVAGFNEAGESLESTIAREIKEEVNIEVKDIRYIRSQPWPFPNALMLGFSARYAGGDIKPDGIEIEDARWFSRDSLPLLPGGASVSRYLINLWLERKL